jgi:oxepin-CoA hydrolase/3-oxo-5,6-dehydrosuberyl-CoA semialdehyde dehydrogenase
MERIESYAGGEWKAGTGSGVPLMNPALEVEVARADTSGIDMAQALVFARREGGEALRRMSFAERAAMLEQLTAAAQKAREALIETSVVNGGCTRSDAKFDVDGAIGTLAAYAEIGKTLGSGRLLTDGEAVQLSRSPRFFGHHVYVSRPGVALLINAFNFPAWGFAEKAACALLAGMPVVCKPATATALTAYRLVRALIESGAAPRGAITFIGGAPGDLLDHLDTFDVVAFTGGAATGRQLRGRKNIVERNIPVNVEADSLNAAVLGPDASLGSDLAGLFLREISKDLVQKTGQKCTAVRRILLPEALAADVIAELAARLAEIKLGDPAHSEVGMGPLATRAQLDDVRAGVGRLMKDAAVVHGDPATTPPLVGVPAGKGYFHPILLLKARDPNNSPEVHSHEVFGPVATICTYSADPDAAVGLVRAGGGGLVASVYSDDREFTEAMVVGLAPYHGRVYLGSSKVADHTLGPGTVLPNSIHGGPGRAGGGEELGGLRGIKHFMQRTAVQGFRSTIDGLGKL